jgi:hypothetical protein
LELVRPVGLEAEAIMRLKQRKLPGAFCWDAQEERLCNFNFRNPKRNGNFTQTTADWVRKRLPGDGRNDVHVVLLESLSDAFVPSTMCLRLRLRSFGPASLMKGFARKKILVVITRSSRLHVPSAIPLATIGLGVVEGVDAVLKGQLHHGVPGVGGVLVAKVHPAAKGELRDEQTRVAEEAVGHLGRHGIPLGSTFDRVFPRVPRGKLVAPSKQGLPAQCKQYIRLRFAQLLPLKTLPPTTANASTNALIGEPNPLDQRAFY